LKRWLSIVGIGEDGLAGLSPVSRRLIEEARLVVGAARHLALADPLVRGDRLAWPSPIDAAFPSILGLRGHPVTVLASGDPFHFGIGKQIAAIVAPEEFVCIPHASAFSLAAARLGWALQDVATVRLHGRAIEGVIRHLQPGARVLALSWDGSTPRELATLLTERDLGETPLIVLERMGGLRERLRTTTALHFDLDDIDPLNTIALEMGGAPGKRIAALAPGTEDDFYENDGQLTKREVRSVTLSALAPRPGQLLWDIGLGAGSIAIEWLLVHPSMRAIGIEERADRAACAARNAAALGAPNLTIVQGRAPEVLKGQATPDAVFIGGGLDDGVLDAAWPALRPGGRLVGNAVTFEGEARLLTAFRQFGGNLIRVEVSRAAQLGGLHGWRAARPVTQWSIVKR
jgi:precorrin-6Y C5,15-methyltransferase (decarboxylating)